MKKAGFKSLFFAFIITFALAAGQVAGAEEFISFYTTGKVTEYEVGETIDVVDGEGDSHTYFISPDTEMPEKIEEGMLVEVTVSNVLAIKVEVLSK
jgi:hypothetical protein